MKLLHRAARHRPCLFSFNGGLFYEKGKGKGPTKVTAPAAAVEPFYANVVAGFDILDEIPDGNDHARTCPQVSVSTNVRCGGDRNIPS